MGTPSLEAPRNLIVSVMEDRKPRLQGKMHSLLIYFRRMWEMMFYTTVAGCVLFNYEELPYTPCAVLCWGHFVWPPGGSVRTQKKAPLYLGRKETQLCWKDMLTDRKSLLRTIKRQPAVL